MSIARHILLYSLILSTYSCAENSIEHSLINTSHLDHLYQAVDIDSTLRLGTIWIYSNAPDYPLVDDTDEGFTCVDDVARALVFYCREYKRNPVQAILEKIKSLTGFIMYMQAENAYYYNFLFPDNGINTVHINSRSSANFWSWRAFWALTEMNLLKAPELDSLQAGTLLQMDETLDNILNLFKSDNGLNVYDGISIPSVIEEYGADQVAAIMIGLSNYYQLDKSPEIEKLLRSLAQYLLATQFGDENSSPYFAFLSWKNIWHAWGNMQAYALLNAGQILEEEGFIEAGLKEVDHFYKYCMEENYISDFRLVRSDNTMKMMDVHSFPQIAYGMRPMIYASLKAYDVTGDEAYARQAGELTMWFFGENPANQVMYDRLTGRTFDGINSESKVNYNSGAESTIEALLSIQAMESNPISRRFVMEKIK